jgi:hypothetical protein
MRNFLFALDEFKLVCKTLTTQQIVDILAQDDPRVRNADNDVNLEIEVHIERLTRNTVVFQNGATSFRGDPSQ